MASCLKAASLFLLQLLILTPSPAQKLSFSPTTISVGSSPRSVHLFDFDQDALPDLVFANSLGQASVTVVLQSADGNMMRTLTTATGGFSSIAVTGQDFNHDGKADLAAVNALTNNVSILLGNGDGTFRLAGTQPVQMGPIAIAAADFNQDRNMDLAVVNCSTGNVSILLGNGDGTFAPAPTVNVGSAPTGLAIDDFNGDGIPDLAVLNGILGKRAVQIFLGNGNGAFRAAGSVIVGNEPFSAATADFNHDGHRDLAVANLASNNISILLGNGDGTFHPAVNYAAGKGPVAIKVGKFYNYNRLDLAVCANGSNEILILAGKGDGTFYAPQTFPAGGDCNSLAVGDLNLDGKMDIVTVNSSGLVVLYNTSQ